MTCPLCSQAVKENWKRCPACEALLVCPGCGYRLPKGSHTCPQCREADNQNRVEIPERFTDHVCGIEMVYVPAGEFKMGDTFGQGADDELPVHGVALEGFYIGRYTVAQAQWRQLMSDNPSRFEGLTRPVEQVTWDAAKQFIDRLNQAHQGQYEFDLPTEAQWEYAARSSGKEELYAGGNDINGSAWYEGNSQGRSHPVGKKKPNGLGLYDMSGNVWEWCRDAYMEDAYASHARSDPWVDLLEPDRVIRGGSWHLDAWSARCARRFSCAREFLGPALGFRLVMVPQ